MDNLELTEDLGFMGAELLHFGTSMLMIWRGQRGDFEFFKPQPVVFSLDPATMLLSVYSYTGQHKVEHFILEEHKDLKDVIQGCTTPEAKVQAAHQLLERCLAYYAKEQQNFALTHDLLYQESYQQRDSTFIPTQLHS